MSSKKICTFCNNKGIPGPHNHTVRNWKIEGKPVICPELLANICSCCNNIGHTRQYCPLRQSSTSILPNNNTSNNASNNTSNYNNKLKRSVDNMIVEPKWPTAKFQKTM